MQYDESYARTLIARVHWTWAKTYVAVPHEYIVRGGGGRSDDEFEYRVHGQREYGVVERWHKYNFPYLYIDGYKYWTMGDTIEDTTIINRQKVFSEFDNIGVMEELQPETLYNQVAQLFHNAFPDRDVYEVGCGTGVTFVHFHIETMRYRGVDPSKKAIEQFKQSHPELSNRLFVNSFEESVNYWSMGTAVILATFGAASYFMHQYLEILAKSGQDYFLMFYCENYCPEQFKNMHQFNYSEKDLKIIFPMGYNSMIDNYWVTSSINFSKTIIRCDARAKI